MDSITVGELKEILKDFNDHEEVKLELMILRLSAEARLLVGECEDVILEVEE